MPQGRAAALDCDNSARHLDWRRCLFMSSIPTRVVFYFVLIYFLASATTMRWRTVFSRVCVGVLRRYLVGRYWKTVTTSLWQFQNRWTTGSIMPLHLPGGARGGVCCATLAAVVFSLHSYTTSNVMRASLRSLHWFDAASRQTFIIRNPSSPGITFCVSERPSTSRRTCVGPGGLAFVFASTRTPYRSRTSIFRHCQISLKDLRGTANIWWHVSTPHSRTAPTPPLDRPTPRPASPLDRP